MGVGSLEIWYARSADPEVGFAERLQCAARIEEQLCNEPDAIHEQSAAWLARAYEHVADVVELPFDTASLAAPVEAWMERSAAFQTEEVGLAVASIHFIGTIEMVPEMVRRARVASIAELMQRYPACDTPRVAYQWAKACVNLGSALDSPEQRLEIADRIEAKMQSDSSFATADLAGECAMAIPGVVRLLEDEAELLALAERAEALFASYPATRVAAWAGLVLAEVADRVGPAHLAELAARLDFLRNRAPSDRLLEAWAQIQAALGGQASSASAALALADGIEAAAAEHSQGLTPGMAESLAIVLHDASRASKDLVQVRGIVERLEAIGARGPAFQTSRIAYELRCAKEREQALQTGDKRQGT